MAIKLTATSSFDGTEGFIRAGQTFEVETEARADKLVNELKLANRAEDGAEVNVEKPLDDYTVPELKEKASDLNIQGYNDMRKAELITAIQQADQTTRSAAADAPNTGTNSPTATEAAPDAQQESAPTTGDRTEGAPE